MRGKRAKQLRAIARENTVGAPSVLYTNRTHRAGYQLLLAPGCTRKEYKQLKRSYKEGRRA